MTNSELNAEVVLKLEMLELKQQLALLQHEAAHAFYQWENSTYGTNSTLSDDDRATWMQGYVYAYKQLKGLL